jgi:hypothetical protein
LARHSGRQKRPVEPHGAAGTIALPQGPGAPWRLLAAAMRVHVGEGLIVGLGQAASGPTG